MYTSPQGQAVAPPTLAAEQKLLLLELMLQHWLGAAYHALPLIEAAPADAAAALNIIFEGARQRQHGTQANIWPEYRVWHEATDAKLSSMHLSPAEFRTEYSLLLKDVYQRQQANQARLLPEMSTQPGPELGQINQPADQPTQSLTELEQGTEHSDYFPTWDAVPSNSNARIRNLSMTDPYDLEDLVLWLHIQVSHQQCSKVLAGCRQKRLPLVHVFTNDGDE